MSTGRDRVGNGFPIPVLTIHFILNPMKFLMRIKVEIPHIKFARIGFSVGNLSRLNFLLKNNN